MKAIQIISQDLFDKVRSRFTKLEMGDESGAVTIDPAMARFFDFDFVIEGSNLGRVSISLNDRGSLKIYYSQGITENLDDPVKQLWYRFLKEMRFFAKRRLLRFDTRDVFKTNLDKNDFQYLATNQAPKEENMNESKWNQKSSKKTSRAVRGKTEVIVRHSKPVDEMYAGSRSQRKNIKAIFIQNKDGERFKYPFIHTAGAFAMAQHVDHDGVPHDPAGKAIIKMSEQIAQLQEFQRQVQRTSLHDDAMGITDRAVGRLTELKAQIEALGKRHHYESWISEFSETEDPMLGELDAVTMETYKQKFTQTDFKEELSTFFPLIHSIMQEKIDLDEYVKESDYSDEGVLESPVDVNEFAQFEQWAEAIEQGKLTDDQIADLKAALAELPEDGLDLNTAFNFFNEFGIEDSDLQDKLQQAQQLDSETDPMVVFKLWAEDSYPELLVALGMSDTQAPPEAAPMEPQAAPQSTPTGENTDMQMPPGVSESNGSVMKDIAETVRRFYNKDNADVGPIRDPETVCLEVEKKHGPQAGQIARQFMEKLTRQWEEKHQKSIEELAPQQDEDGLSELRDVLSRIKSKVEGIGDRGHSGQDFNRNIMSAEEIADEGALDKVKALGKRVLDKLAPDDEALLKDLQKKVGVPQTGKPPAKSAESVEFESILKLAGLTK